MLKLKEFFKKNVFIITLCFLVIILFFTNYIPGTYLVGWDNLSTEFDPVLGLKRALFGGWQEHQSFGLPAGLSHATDIFHSIAVLLLRLLLPLNVVRYVFHILMLLFGSIGMYLLLKYLLEPNHKGHSLFLSNIGAFVGSLFYIFNLGTIQIFSLPHESFSIFFALLPWLVLSFMKYLHSHSIFDRKHLLILIILNLLGSSFAFIQTLFFVYLLVLFCISISILIGHKDKLFYLKKLLISFTFIFLVNTYWILPQTYFLSTSYKIVGESKINQLATETIFNRNKEKGTFFDFVKMEGFYYESLDTSSKDIFFPWKNYFSNSVINILRFIPFIFIILGLFKFNRDHFGFVLIFLLCTIALMSRVPIFSDLNDVLRSNLFLNQIFRSPFTKFILVYSFVASYFFMNGLEVFINFFQQKNIFSSYVLHFLAILLILALNIPAFTGNMFASSMRVSLPKDYIDLMAYLKSVDKNKRIALLPEYTHWGWFKYDWGYDGSGFLWYGVEQPIVSRTFDVWSPSSESYYWEIKDALEDNNSARFENILSKYNISYLLLDTSITPISGQNLVYQFEKLGDILKNTNNIKYVESFGSLKLYEFIGISTNNYIDFENNLISVAPHQKILDLDKAFLDLGNYFIDTVQPEYFYPFIDLTSVTELPTRGWNIEETASSFIISASIKDININNYRLNYKEDYTTIPFRILRDGFLVTENLPVSIRLSYDQIYISIDKILVDKTELLSSNVYSCGNKKGFVDSKQSDNSIILKSSNGERACIDYDFPLLPHWNSYLIKSDVNKTSGIAPFMYILGSNSGGQAKIEKNLPEGTSYSILNTGYDFDDGYSISFQNNSYKGITTENRIYNSYIYLFPFDYLKNLRLELINNDLPNKVNNLEIYDISMPNYYTYKISVSSVSPNSTLILNQSYDPGWISLCDRELCKAKHVIVNNWANGWIFDGPMPQNIEVIFWPQYLEYLGFVLLLIPFWLIIRHKN